MKQDKAVLSPMYCNVHSIALRMEIRIFHLLIMGKKIAEHYSIESANYQIPVCSASLVYK